MNKEIGLWESKNKKYFVSFNDKRCLKENDLLIGSHTLAGDDILFEFDEEEAYDIYKYLEKIFRFQNIYGHHIKHNKRS